MASSSESCCLVCKETSKAKLCSKCENKSTKTCPVCKVHTFASLCYFGGKIKAIITKRMCDDCYKEHRDNCINCNTPICNIFVNNDNSLVNNILCNACFKEDKKEKDRQFRENKIAKEKKKMEEKAKNETLKCKNSDCPNMTSSTYCDKCHKEFDKLQSQYVINRKK